jgi:uncharacterized protein involved in exopolysaccharide biosynthesis
VSGTVHVDVDYGFIAVMLWVVRHAKLLIGGPLLAGLVALGVSFFVPKTYLSRTSFVPPQQQQSVASAALSQLGALSGLAGTAAGIKAPADLYVALLQSTTVADRIIDAFQLTEVYGVEYRERARETLKQRVSIVAGRKDGLIVVEVIDRSAERAARMANRYVEELRVLTSRLALTEAQQRKSLFEAQMLKTRDLLAKAQLALQATGFSQGALRADARAAAEGYARLQAEATAADVRLQALRRNLTEDTPEVRQAAAVVGTLRAQLARLEESSAQDGRSDYVTRFREFKYQETLFDLLARQYELARVDEAREGALIQIVDEAHPAELKHRPLHALIALAAAAASLVLLVLALWLRETYQELMKLES